MMYILFIIITALILMFAFYEWQYYVIFRPTYCRGEDDFCESIEVLSVITDDDVELEGVIYEPKNFEATMLFFSGRSQDSVGLINKLSLSYPQTRIITFNYRSYGKSKGKISEKNLYSDALKVAELVQKYYGDFYILGFSLGSVVGAYVATKMSVKGLFLVGSFDSMANLVKGKYGISISWLLRYKFDNVEFVKNIDSKTYLFSSKDDEITYIKNARRLKDSVKNLVLYKEFSYLSHKELLWDIRVIDEIKSRLKL